MTKLRDWTSLFALACLWACGGGPEQTALDQFFRAAQTDDHTTVALMSAAAPPVAAESWEVVEVASRTKIPFTLPELREEYDAAEKARDEGTKKRTEYFEENRDALEQIIPKLRDEPDYEFSGKLGEIQKEWEAMQEERVEVERRYQEAKRRFDQESRLATRSVARQVPLDDFEGEVDVSEVLLNLTPEGGAALPFKATLRRYAVTDPEIGRLEQSRWVIVGFEGMTPEARAAAEGPAEESAPAPAPASAPEPAAEASEAPKVAEVRAEAAPAPKEEADAGYMPKELRGSARVQILAPESKVVGNEVVTTIRARNVSRDWITRFTATEHWYDDQGNAVSTTSRTHQDRFMPNEIVELELRTAKGDNFFQNQFEFVHANGEVNAAVVESFPGT